MRSFRFLLPVTIGFGALTAGCVAGDDDAQLAMDAAPEREAMEIGPGLNGVHSDDHYTHVTDTIETKLDPLVGVQHVDHVHPPNTPAMTDLLATEGGRRVLEHLYQCALGGATTVRLCITAPGAECSGEVASGSVGMAPGWATQPLANDADQQNISGCLVGMINNHGSVPVYMHYRPAGAPPLNETIDPSLEASDATFFGNLFGAGVQGNTYSCTNHPGAYANSHLAQRVCDNLDDCRVEVLGWCHTATSPDPVCSAVEPWSQCEDPAGIVWQYPVTVTVPKVSVAAGVNFAIKLAPTHQVYTAGANQYGQLGDGTLAPHLFPMQVPGLGDANALATGDYHAVALRTTGTLRAWGNNTYGQLGDGTNTHRSSPVAVLNLGAVISVEAGPWHTLALRSDGLVYSWGLNNYGQLGDGTTLNRSTPFQVPPVNHVTSFSAGLFHSVALRDDGTVWTWGRNQYGQLGDGTTLTRTTPVQVPITNVVAVAAGSSHTLALRGDGTVWAWGLNSVGHLGLGFVDSVAHPVPALVPALGPTVAIAAGANHSIALGANGTAYSWGYNGQGQLGTGTTTNRSTAGLVVIPGGSPFVDVKTVTAGANQTYLGRGNGDVFAIGANTNGQLGDGTTTNRSYPQFTLFP